MRVTKKLIQDTIRTQDSTKIYRIAKICGVDVKRKEMICRFIEQYAPTQKIKRSAFKIAFRSGQSVINLMRVNSSFSYRKYLRSFAIHRAHEYAKYQIRYECYGTRYLKLLTVCEDTSTIYWASPLFGLRDYNKTAAMILTERNILASQIINNMITKAQ